MFKIEKGIPLVTHRSLCNKYPFADMEVDDSFLLGELTVKEAAIIRSAAVAHGRAFGKDFCEKRKTTYDKQYNKTFAIRKMGKSYRCWRVA